MNNSFNHSLNLIDLLHQTEGIIIEVADWILSQQKGIQKEDVQSKSLNSLVTYVDQQAELKLTKQLGTLLPAARFCAEEGHPLDQWDETKYYWIIDPLDGTTNYLHQIPIFSVSVALSFGSNVLLGVVYDIQHREMFSAIGGGGFFINGTRFTSSTKHPVTLSQSIIATGMPYHDFTIKEAYLKILSKVLERTRGVRRLGSAAIDLAYVAAGRFNAFFEYGLNPWDVAAGVLCVQESGGIVTDFRGKSFELLDPTILAAHSELHAPISQLIHEAL